MMTMMKNPIILVTCVLLLSSLAVLASQSSFGPDDCCFQFFSKRLPKNRVMTYQYTDERCTNKAVLFTMRNHAKICVNPSEQWVKSIIETKQWIHIKTGNSSASEPSE
ncbi:C-C motif chemokine 5-like [Micropterus salmoides]|uniref:C-C motif chemokine 5-like n=1 Tax=Micropterus salmoides TaxID=27706 RepID=UPI0018EA4C7F|nr:C-C motif chemokine 5-like [Micropterus salmoides]